VNADGPVGAATPTPRVLLVEDDAALVGMLTGLLGGEGYAVDAAADGHHGLHLGLTRGYDVLVLDRRLPALDGLDLLRRLRRSGVTTPALMLSALGNPADRVAGLDAGAEDYLAKPFDVEELLARLRALRRRHLDAARMLPLGELGLDLDTQQVVAWRQWSGSQGSGSQESGPPGSEPPARPAIRLSQRECALLALLAGRPSRIFTRPELLRQVFPGASSEVVVDTYVHYLRRKLGDGAVVTVRGRGYRLGRA